ncbi:RNA-binding region-containing protein 3 [Callorhinchus milii]|uniref:RNA-binding region-containing protein 3 n=1 Tax=Callorhinchus milii TaxID=7868 RepID=A0A4W3HVZ9_CALMI|nr:RNA-binding region-containing protein 3 [Callorhinchus milii]XP_007885480.1 RNA-binding region-containing protein 3 [Callorhinchus milii]|eukprot:gi/632940739/ref/XP_007885479.1/ PREDICTED: RNA-binding protein 40 [Callorhinchus milii]
MAAVINKSKNGRTVIVRHLPAELARNEKEELLQCFGAESVRVFSDRGRMKHTAFATFPSENAAAKALTRLHQLKILGHTLVVEFVKEHVHLPDQPKPIDKSMCEDKTLRKDVRETLKPSGPVIENGIAPKLGLIQPMNPCLKYLYPPPTSVILANIANAMASVPKFYVQVLHLMNKMNLPAPFGPITARPPMYEEYSPAPPPMPPLPPEEPPLPEEEMDVSSEEESEYESGSEEDKERMIRLLGLATLPPKRILKKKLSSVRKRPKLKDLINVPKAPSQSTHSAVPPSEVFEQPQTHSQKKIAFHISADVVGLLEGGVDRQEEQENTAEAQSIGFGKIHPTPVYSKIEEDEEEEEEILTEFISRRDLAKGRISKEEIESISVFKKYYPGEPTCRLYVKNLSKQAEEKDLKFIFGRYIDFSSETERNMFDIRLMKEGRMKGQAFIGLPNEKSAIKALKEVNGYVLQEKPMVVQFARSARPKQDLTEGKRSKQK